MAPISDAIAGVIMPRATSQQHQDPGLLANLVCRVVLGLLANTLCWVPLTLLYRNGEFAAVVLIVTVMVLNLLTVVNALVWRDDDVASWPSGEGWCDFTTYLYSPLLLIYTGCVLAIMRNLAIQLGSLRAHPATGAEKKRRSLVQALIIFPLPLLELVWVYPLTVQRYGIATLVGCVWVSDSSWPYVVFYLLPAPILSLITGYYAVLAYTRFRQVQKTTQTALSKNQLAAARAHRANRRLFLMTLSILIPYLPLSILYAVTNSLNVVPLHAYDFRRIHEHDLWDVVVPIVSDNIDFTFMNSCYIPILTALPIFWFFGRTKDAINTYRRYLVACGLGYLFPKMREAYDPDSRLYADSTSATATFSTEKNTKTRSSVSHEEAQPSNPTHGLLSRISWAALGFGRRKADFDNVPSSEIASASRPAGLSTRFGVTTHYLNNLVRHHKAQEPKQDVPSRSAAPSSTYPYSGNDSERIWTSSPKLDFSTRVWTGNGSALTPTHGGSDSQPAVSGSSGVMVTKLIASETEQSEDR